MKKIIELAEKYFAEIDNADGIEELEYQAEESKIKLQEALAEYKRLSETPITEDWLKEHGWEVFEGYGDIYYKDFDTKRIECTRNLVGMGIIIYGDGISSSLTGLRSVANLYDACELCGITMD